MVIIWWASPVLTPILLAAYIAALCWPLYGWLQRRGVHRGLSLVILLLVVFGVVGGIIGLLFLSAREVRNGLEQYSDGLDSGLASIARSISGVSPAVDSALGGIDGSSLTSFLDGFMTGVIEAAANGLFALVLVAFFLLESGRFIRLFETGLSDTPVISQVPYVVKAAIQYFLVRIQLNLLTALLFGGLLLLLGVDHALLWAVLTFFLSFVPYIGLTVAMIPPALLALAEFGPARAVGVVIGAIVINLAIENIVEPQLTGKKLKLSPTAVFISFFFWGWLLGPVGVMLAMPITVMILLVLDRSEETAWAALLIGPSLV